MQTAPPVQSLEPRARASQPAPLRDSASPTRPGAPLQARTAQINLHQCLPRNNFKLFFTLVSKCFSSFPHGTCPLSVSRQYLALDHVYDPLCAALPSNATLGTLVVLVSLQRMNGILTLSDALFQGTYLWRCGCPRRDKGSRGHNSLPRLEQGFST